MTYKDYKQRALSLPMFYPNVGNNYQYTLFGLTGEFGELCEKIQFYFNCGMPKNVVEYISKEIGDVVWYIAASDMELKLDLSLDDRNEFLSFDKVALSFQINYYLLCCITEIGKINETIKKAIRDKNGIIDNNTIKLNFKNLYINLTCLAYLFSLNINQIMQENLDKLNDRNNRGKLRGSGDNR